MKKNLFDKKISEKNKTEIELDLNQTGSSGKGQFDIHWFHFLLELFFSFLNMKFQPRKKHYFMIWLNIRLNDSTNCKH